MGKKVGSEHGGETDPMPHGAADLNNKGGRSADPSLVGFGPNAGETVTPCPQRMTRLLNALIRMGKQVGSERGGETDPMPHGAADLNNKGGRSTEPSSIYTRGVIRSRGSKGMTPLDVHHCNGYQSVDERLCVHYCGNAKDGHHQGSVGPR
jgi:hypothetical protein